MGSTHTNTPINDSPAFVKSGPGLYIFLHNKLRWLLISFKELWTKTESARSSLRTAARSTCEYTLKLTSSLTLFMLTGASFQCTISLGFYILPRQICRDDAKTGWFNFCNFYDHKMKTGWSCTKSLEQFLILRLNWRKVWVIRKKYNKSCFERNLRPSFLLICVFTSPSVLDEKKIITKYRTVKITMTIPLIWTKYDETNDSLPCNNFDWQRKLTGLSAHLCALRFLCLK